MSQFQRVNLRLCTGIFYHTRVNAALGENGHVQLCCTVAMQIMTSHA